MDSIEFQLAKLTYFNGPPFQMPTCLCQLPTVRSKTTVERTETGHLQRSRGPMSKLSYSAPRNAHWHQALFFWGYPRGIPCAHSWHASANPSHHVDVSTNSPWLKATRMQSPAPYLPPNVVHQSFPALGPKPLAWKCVGFILWIRFHNRFKSWCHDVSWMYCKYHGFYSFFIFGVESQPWNVNSEGTVLLGGEFPWLDDCLANLKN